MENILNISLSDNIDKDSLYNLFTSKESDKNIDLLAKILTFNSNIEFFNFYSGINLDSLLNFINKLKSGLSSILLNKNTEENNSYFSSLSKIIVSLLLINKINKITNESLVKIQKYSHNFFKTNNVNLKLKSEIKECINELLSNNDYFHRNDKKTDNFSDISRDIKETITPKYEQKSKLDKFKRFASSGSLCNVRKKDFQSKLSKNGKNFNNSCRSFKDLSKKKIIKRSSNSSKKGYKSDNLNVIINDTNSVNYSSGETPKNIYKKKLSKFVKKARRVVSDENTKFNSIEKTSSQENSSFSKQVYTDMYFNLLQIIKEGYQKCLINSEEKLLLKKIIISKEEDIYYIYKKYYLNTFSKDNSYKQQLLNEMKKFLLQSNL